MFLNNKVNFDELFSEMEYNLKKRASDQDTYRDRVKLQALELMLEASQDLEALGFQKVANSLVKISEESFEDEKEDLLTLSADQMVKNLEETGWEFPPPKAVKIESSTKLPPADIEVSDTEEPLSEDELNGIKNLWAL